VQDETGLGVKINRTHNIAVLRLGLEFDNYQNLVEILTYPNAPDYLY